MVVSMTAFARREHRAFIWELRSVNHRSFDTSFRLPTQYRGMEHELAKRAAEEIRRGRLDATLRMTELDSANSLSINSERLTEVSNLFAQARKSLDSVVSGDIQVHVVDILKWAGVVEETNDANRLDEAILETYDESLNDLVAMREREGRGLATIVETHLDDLDRLVVEIAQIADGQPSLVRDRIEKRIADLDLTVESSRLAQEIAVLAQRADVTEEIDRLNLHLSESRSCLRGPGPHGRRLDFLVQELAREANTLASKLISLEASSRTVDLKILVDQIREQAHNIE